MAKHGDFAAWLEPELRSRSWSISDLAKKSGVSRAHLSRILSGTRKPGAGALGSLARALELPLNLLLQKAGYLAAAAQDEFEEEWKHIINQASSPEEKRELIERARYELTKIRERRAQYKTR